MKARTSTPVSRWQKRSLSQLLVHKFLHEYGYENGVIVAQAIVEDILATINEYYGDKLPPHHVIWPAVSVENGSTGKSPAIRAVTSVRLQLVTDEEVALLNDQHLCGLRIARRTFNQQRFARWCFDAFEQGGVLTCLDLSLLSGLSEGQVSHLLRQYEEKHHCTVPIRGTVHDIGPSVSHKAEVIRRFLRGQNPADIARELNHSQQAVDAYIKDYEITRKLVQKFPVHEIPAFSKRALSVVNEHVKLILQYEPDVIFYSDSQPS